MEVAEASHYRSLPSFHYPCYLNQLKHRLYHTLGAPVEVAEASDTRSLPSFHFAHNVNQNVGLPSFTSNPNNKTKLYIRLTQTLNI